MLDEIFAHAIYKLTLLLLMVMAFSSGLRVLYHCIQRGNAALLFALTVGLLVMAVIRSDFFVIVVLLSIGFITLLVMQRMGMFPQVPAS